MKSLMFCGLTIGNDGLDSDFTKEEYYVYAASSNDSGT